jgi:hypothetical protein
MTALKSHGCHLTFVSTVDMLDRNPHFEALIDDFYSVTFSSSSWMDFREMLRLNKFFRSKGIKKVILNTAQGGHVRNLCLTAPRSIEYIGIIHTLKKFQGSFTQKLINRKIKKYLVLNDFFLNKIEKKRDQVVASFYPLRFPHFDKKIEKPIDQTWITIIGGVENRRKDLRGSIELMKNTPDSVHFIFLGKSDRRSQDRIELENAINNSSLQNRVHLFNEFVPSDDFDAYLRSSDVIWPMVHPNTPSAQEYFRNQISGAMNVSFAYKIPMLVHLSFMAEWQDLKDAISYDLDSFQENLENGLSQLDALTDKMENTSKFQPEFQEKKYLDFIFDQK